MTVEPTGWVRSGICTSPARAFTDYKEPAPISQGNTYKWCQKKTDPETIIEGKNRLLSRNCRKNGLLSPNMSESRLLSRKIVRKVSRGYIFIGPAPPEICLDRKLIL